MDLIAPPTLLEVVVVFAACVVVVGAGVVVVFCLDSAHCLHFSRTRPLQDQHPAPDTSWQEEGMFSSIQCWQVAAPSSVARSQHCALQFPSWDSSMATWAQVEPAVSRYGDLEHGAKTQARPP